jgi:erythromycin esterase-like protein
MTKSRVLLLLLMAGCGTVAQPGSQARDSNPPGDPLAVVVGSARSLEMPGNENSPGLQQLDAIIGDAQVVMLGEPWHGDGAAITLRAELVRHLHEKKGFDVLVFESDFFGLTHGWQSVIRAGNVGRFAADNVYPFWATTYVARPLWDYIDESLKKGKPLAVAGIDPKHVGAESRRELPALMDSLFQAHTTLTAAQRAGFRGVLQKHLLNDQYRPDTANLKSFYAALDAIQESIDLLPLAQRNSFAAQEVKNLRASADYTWRGASRDRAMGENLAWIATQLYPGRKMIVWAHNNHVAMSKWMYFNAPDTAIQRSVSRQSVASKGRSTYLGVEAKHFFGSRVVSIATLSYGGYYTPDVRTHVDTLSGEFERGNFDSVTVLAPAPSGTVESALNAAGLKVAVVDLRPFRGTNTPLSTRAFDYTVTPPLAMRYWEGYDGFLFIRSAFGLKGAGPQAPGR